MRIIALAIACMAVFAISAAASGPSREFVYGVEWGSGLTFHTYHIYNYVREDGTRMQGNDFQFVTNLNASLLFKAGYDFGSRWNLSLVTGYDGINDRFRVIPLGFRGTCFFREGQRDSRPFLFAEPGAGLFSSSDKYAFYLRVGYGKRFNLSPGTDLDFSVCYRLTHSCPKLIDPDDEIIDRLFSNNILTGFFGVSMSLHFKHNVFKR